MPYKSSVYSVIHVIDIIESACLNSLKMDSFGPVAFKF